MYSLSIPPQILLVVITIMKVAWLVLNEEQDRSCIQKVLETSFNLPNEIQKWSAAEESTK